MTLESGLPWPCTIVRTRYSGCYEGGAWAAFNLYGDSGFLVGHDGPDLEAAEWWDLYRNSPWVAVGNTPQQALDNLTRKLKSNE